MRFLRVRQGVVATTAAILMTGGLFAFDAVPAGAASITSPGPLTQVGVGTTLDCSANHAGDTSGEFYGDTSCGTFLSVDGALYGPFLGTTYTPVSQTGPTGTGTNADPFKIVTVVDAGTSGIRLTQTDTYTTGLESFRTDVAVANNTATAKAVRLYRAADCYLQNSDAGYGAADTANGAVACTTGTESGARIEQWFPITSGSHYYESFYNTVYSQISAQAAFPDTCDCATLQDNGAGLSWDATIPSDLVKTFSSFITFSPLGIMPLSMSITPDAASVPSGGSAGYTISVQNPNATAVALSSLSDVLPATFSYTAGSSTGLTTANPTVGSGNTLTWAGPLSVPGAGSASLHFTANVGTTTGTFMSSASATNDSGYTIAPTGPDGAVTVSGAELPPIVANLAPVSGTATLGTDQAYTVTATRNAVPTAGLSVIFGVLSGPDAVLFRGGTTDSAGQATFTVHGVAEGTDVALAGVADGFTSAVTNGSSVVWQSATASGLHVSGMANPAVITAGGAGQVHFVITNDGPSAANGVYAAFTVPVGGTPISITPSRGGCSGFSGRSSICLFGTVANGDVITVDVLVQSPPSASGVFPTAIMVNSDGSGPTNDEFGPSVAAAAPGTAVGYVPPGGTISTGTTATPTDPTVASFQLPGSGVGAPIELRVETAGVTTFCAGQPCAGKILFLSPFAGYTNPRSPARLTITWDKTVAGNGTASKLYVQKQVDGPIVEVPMCANTSKHIAIPSPCIHEKETISGGDVRFEIVLLSGDPRFARR
ncbi:MAG: hypothetical protein ABJC79_07740 [Acidimicrobiia bacterium]